MSNEQGKVQNLNNVGKDKRPSGYKGQGNGHKPGPKLSAAERAEIKAKADADSAAEALRRKYELKRIRTGKTRRERIAGAAHKNAQNRDSRASWQNDRKADGSNSTSFPVASCNGRRNRYQVTGKDGATVYLKTASTVGKSAKR
jgi:hypothetical protein